MICFGIDPGSWRTGWGVVRIDGNQVTWVDSGCIFAPKEATLEARLEPIFVELRKQLDLHRPELVVLESIFHHKSAKSALILGHARGVALLAARMAECEILEITPAEVKKAVVGNGRATKEQIQQMVRILLRRPAAEQADTADALAVAIAGTARARSPLLRAVSATRPAG